MSQKEIISENHNRSNYREVIIGLLALIDTLTTQLLYLKLREHYGKRGRFVRSRGPGKLLEIVSPKNGRKDSPMVPQLYG